MTFCFLTLLLLLLLECIAIHDTYSSELFQLIVHVFVHSLNLLNSFVELDALFISISQCPPVIQNVYYKDTLVP